MPDPIQKHLNAGQDLSGVRAAFHTLGCKVNQYETEAISEAFARRGAAIVPEDSEADVYIVNTCTVTNMADRKSRQFIRRMKGVNPEALMVVTGCYAQVAADELAAMPDVDLIIGNNLKSEIPDRVAKLLREKQLSPGADFRVDSEVLAYHGLSTYEDMGIVTSSESGMSRAYIKIEEGCNRFCSYCLIPYARGRIRSRNPEEILKEARMLLEKGFREIVLTGINTALYGREADFTFDRLPGEEDMDPLEAVISRLNALEGHFRIRLSSLEPTVVDKAHIEKIVRYEKLCHHLHLSIQSGSNTVLERMNRHYSIEDYLEIIRALRAFDPLYGITTDIIVGFQGETDEEFLETEATVRKAAFGRCHIFRYSPRKGTAALKLPGSIPGTVKNARAHTLEASAAKAAEAFNRRNLGSIQEVLVEECGDLAEGYTGNYIKTYMVPDGLVPGDLIRVRLTALHEDGCFAETL